MVYYDHFGAYIPFSQEERFYKEGLMSPSSEGFYKAEISSKEIVNAVLKNIREIQEESGPKLFQHNFAESKESNSPIIQPPIIISDLLKRHGIL